MKRMELMCTKLKYRTKTWPSEVTNLIKHICWFHQLQTFYFCFCIFSILVVCRNQLNFVGNHWIHLYNLYTRQASMDMDISMDIHAKSVDMDMDEKFHIHGNPAYSYKVAVSFMKVDRITHSRDTFIRNF